MSSNLSVTLDSSVKKAVEENSYHFSNKSDMVRQALTSLFDKPTVIKPIKRKRARTSVCYSLSDELIQLMDEYCRVSGFTVTEVFEMAIEDFYQEKGFYLQELDEYKEFKSPLVYKAAEDDSTF